jgi:hypothetical protein
VAKDPDGSHLRTQREGKAHKPQKQLEDGACIWGHDTDYRKDWSCSYRWQVHEFSKGDTARKNVHNKRVDKFWPRMRKQVETSAYQKSPSKPVTPANYDWEINKPREPEDWYLDGPKKAGYEAVDGIPIPVGLNFQACTYPYWFNAHHVIPKGTLLEILEEVATAKGFGANVIRLALLKIKYNVNHYLNVFILPQDTKVARLFKLPRHLILEEGSKHTTYDEEYFNHTEYNDMVADQLRDIFRDFVYNVGQNACAEPEDEDRQFLKDCLEMLSEKCIKKIIEFGKDMPGEPISAMKTKKPVKLAKR